MATIGFHCIGAGWNFLTSLNSKVSRKWVYYPFKYGAEISTILVYQKMCYSLYTKLITYLTEDDLWCKVLRGSTECPGPALHPFRKSKICYL